LLFVADQPHTPGVTAIREGDVFAIGFNLPSRRFVFHRAVIVLELRIALLAGLLVFTIFIEAGNRRPGSISRSLTSLGVEPRCERELFGKLRTVALKIILGDAMPIHPLAQTLVADELDNANGFINRCILLCISVQFVLVDQHQISPLDAWLR
jgi:hypothetical protein